MNTDAEPLFVQIASFVADLIVDGTLKPGEQAPSTNRLAQFHEINPATARKGLALLVDDHVLEKRRGLGMFVREGAREKVRHQRQESLREDFIVPLLKEGAALGLSASDIADLIEAEGDHHDAP